VARALTQEEFLRKMRQPAPKQIKLLALIPIGIFTLVGLTGAAVVWNAKRQRTLEAHVRSKREFYRRKHLRQIPQGLKFEAWLRQEAAKRKRAAATLAGAPGSRYSSSVARATPPTVDAAARLLDKARLELRKAKGHEDKRRQAAEKGWLAARTAATAFLHCAGEDWQQARSLTERVEDLERRTDPQRKPALSTALAHAQAALHGLCFYIGEPEYCTHRHIRLVLDEVEHAIPRARWLCARITK
jgi:hypothetical protein